LDVINDLVLGTALLILALAALAWHIWGRRPAAAAAVEPESTSDAPTIVHEYPRLPHPDELRVADDIPPPRADWQPPINPARLRRWEAQRNRRKVGSDDRG